MDALLTFIGYEAVWFAAVSGAGHGRVWPGLGAAAAFIGWRMGVSSARGVELRLLAVASLIGAMLETLWVRTGRIHYSAAWPLASAPAWLMALWASFGLTIRPLFGWLETRPWLAAVLGAVGGPLSYWAASRGWHAVIFPPQAWGSLAALALGWAAALPLLTSLSSRWQGSRGAHREPRHERRTG
jgi:hypothetical protein